MLLDYDISLLLTLVTACITGIAGEHYQTSLTFNDILPEDPKLYDKMRPPKKDGQPTTVLFHVTVMGLDSIDETSMTYAADIFFAQTWKDHRLRLPENMTSEYRLLEVEWLKNMWRPDSFFKNAKSVTFQTMTIPNHYMWLYKDKTILYMVKLTLRLSCAMNFLIYPHDTQECKLQMESLSHTTDDMIFQWDPEVPLVVDEHIELPQLALVKNNTADCTQVYSTGNFTCLEVVFVLKRRLGYYLFHTYIPTCLIVIMSWVSFWIKPEAAPARVTLGVTSLLTLSTQHAKSQASLPPVSYLKAVDAFMSVCTVFVFMALMEYCLVNIVLGDSEPPNPNPKPHPPKIDRFTDYTTGGKNGKRGSKSLENSETTTVNTFQRQWISFWIKPEVAPARVTLGVTSLLTLSTQHAKSQASLPPVSYLKAVDAFMSVCTVFVFMALMEYCLVNIVLGDSEPPNPNPKPHPPKIDRFTDYTTGGKNGKRGSKSLENSETTTVNTFQRQESTLLLSPVPHIQTIPPPPMKPTSAIPKLTPAQIRLRRAIYVDRSSRVLFPLLFTILNAAYWIKFYEYI